MGTCLKPYCPRVGQDVEMKTLSQNVPFLFQMTGCKIFGIL